MELQDKPMEPEESLRLIQQFIIGSKSNLSLSAFGFIFWGILITVAAWGNYVLALIWLPEKSWIIWPVLSISGFIFTSIYYSVNGRKSGTVSTFGHFFKWLFLCGGITYFLFIFLCIELRVTPMPFMLGLTSLLITVSGLVFRFKPMIYGGFLFFIVTIASVFVSPMNQLLLTGGAFLIGYLVPGILLVSKKEGNA